MMTNGRRLPMSPRLRWVPSDDPENAALLFVRHLIDGQITAPSEQRGRRATYHRETWERTGAMLTRAVLLYLVRCGGWAQVRRVDRNERLRVGRIWDTRAFQRLELTIGEPVMRFTIALFDAMVRRQLDGELDTESDVAKLGLEVARDGSPAEQLALYVVLRPFAMLNQAPGLVRAIVAHSTWLNLTMGADASRCHPPPKDRLEAALEAWGWTLPWISEDVAWWWSNADADRFATGLDGFSEQMAQLATVFDRVADAAVSRERHDWLIPLCDFYRRSYGGVTPDMHETFTRELEEWIEPSSLRERQEYRDLWGGLFHAMTLMGRERDRIQRAHPADREPHERVFVAFWEDTDAETTRERVEALRSHLERVMT